MAPAMDKGHIRLMKFSGMALKEGGKLHLIRMMKSAGVYIIKLLLLE